MISVLRLLFGTMMGSSFDPGLAASADSIPGQVPRAVVIHSEPVEDRTLRGDFEVPQRVLLVYTESWPETIETIAEHVLDSGGQVSLVLEVDNSRAKFNRLVNRIGVGRDASIEVYADIVDTPWVRDWGPLQLRGAGRSLWLDADYDDAERGRDDEAPRWLARRHEVTIDEFPWALDGGAFISNGAGLCVLTFEYLDNQEISWDDDDLGQLLAQLGCRATAVVPTLIAEETKHADMIAQFIGGGRLMMAEILDEFGGTSEDALRLRAAELGIRQAATALGLELEIVHVPTPPSFEWQNPRSYVNGLRLADRYLMPSYPDLGDSWELAAWAAVQDAMGDTPVVPIDTREMIGSGGAIHCASLGLYL